MLVHFSNCALCLIVVTVEPREEAFVVVVLNLRKDLRVEVVLRNVRRDECVVLSICFHRVGIFRRSLCVTAPFWK